MPVSLIQLEWTGQKDISFCSTIKGDNLLPYCAIRCFHFLIPRPLVVEGHHWPFRSFKYSSIAHTMKERIAKDTIPQTSSQTAAIRIGEIRMKRRRPPTTAEKPRNLANIEDTRLFGCLWFHFFRTSVRGFFFDRTISCFC